MSFVSRFIVLIESRRLPRAVVATVTAISLLLSGFGLTAAHAAPGGKHKRDKVALDLGDEVVRAGAPKAKWARDVNGVRHIQAIVVSDDSDDQMRNLRAYIKSIGGAVHAVHPAVHAMTVQVKASDVAEIGRASCRERV